MRMITVICLFIAIQGGLSAQETSDAFLQRVSERYAKIQDYQARIRIQRGDRVDSGRLVYKAPGLIRLDYDSPKGQVLIVNEDKVEFYLPAFQAIMEQRLSRSAAQSMSAIGAGGGNGLKILRDNYSVSYLVGPAPVALGGGSNEMVIKLRFQWRSNAEGFRTLDLSINPNSLMIRRMEGVTGLFENVQFDYTDITLDRGVPTSVFVFVPEEGLQINKYPNFLGLVE
jgi:outer membrane lipoprotein-sorting protein